MTEFRSRALGRVKQDLCLEVRACEKKLEKNKRSAGVISTALTICSGLNVISSGSAAGSLISGIGIIACAPLSTFAVVNSVAILVLNVFSNRKKKRRKLLQKRLALARKYEFMVASKTSQALEDGKISEEEFESLLGMTNTFYNERQKIRESVE